MNTFLLVQPDSGTIVTLEVHNIMDTVKESFTKVVAATQVNP